MKKLVSLACLSVMLSHTLCSTITDHTMTLEKQEQIFDYVKKNFSQEDKHLLIDIIKTILDSDKPKNTQCSSLWCPLLLVVGHVILCCTAGCILTLCNTPCWKLCSDENHSRSSSQHELETITVQQ